MPKTLPLENLFEFIWNLKLSFEILKFELNLQKFLTLEFSFDDLQRIENKQSMNIDFFSVLNCFARRKSNALVFQYCFSFSTIVVQNLPKCQGQKTIDQWIQQEEVIMDSWCPFHAPRIFLIFCFVFGTQNKNLLNFHQIPSVCVFMFVFYVLILSA